MTKKLVMLMIALFFCALPMFAQGGTAAGGGPANNLVPLTAGFAMAIASGLVGLGMGRAVGGAVEGMARNPGAAKVIQTAMILGLVFMETLALYVILIIFVKVQ
jgi:F-type H+-transporting ATPase subunit c